MSKHNLTQLKGKIVPKNSEDESSVFDRFSFADKTLGVETELSNNSEKLTKRAISKGTRKTFYMPENELHYIEQIKEKALNSRIVLSESEAIRLSILVAKDLSDDRIEQEFKKLAVLPKGRPKS